MKVSELTGAMLDYWTARADGMSAKLLPAGERLNGVALESDTCAALTPGFKNWWQPYYVTWFTMGELIERERIGVGFGPFAGCWHAMKTETSVLQMKHMVRGPDPLTAIARCFVASKYGDTVPDELEAG